MASFKRARSPHPQETSPSSSAPSSPTVKAARTSTTPPYAPSTTDIVCELPPTCHHRNTILSGTRELEAHYAKYHAHVCGAQGCGCVFPDARLLELHQTECHDPLAAVRRERGEKIFACHVATCARKFSTPKTRRMHLIQAHGFPKEYFFAVTNKGVGGLLKRWGEGASMLRKPWRPRENDMSEGDGDEGIEGNEDEAEAEAADEQDASISQPGRHTNGAGDGGDDDDDEDEILLEKIQIDRPSVRAGQSDNDARPGRRTRNGSKGKKIMPENALRQDVDTLTSAMDSLSLVPSSIQFGRGAKRGTHRRSGHARRGTAGKGGGAPRGTDGGIEIESMDVDQTIQLHARGRRRGRPLVPRGAAFRGIGTGHGRDMPPVVLGRGAGRVFQNKA